MRERTQLQEKRGDGLEDRGPTLALSINGAFLTMGSSRACPVAGIARSSSPVLVIGGAESERSLLADRLHTSSCRSSHPLHVCRSAEEGASFLDAVLGASGESVLGTWALYDVGRWPDSLQRRLSQVLAYIDECRLHGRLLNEEVPRVVVLERDDGPASGLIPELVPRLSYFCIRPGATRKRKTKRKGRTE